MSAVYGTMVAEHVLNSRNMLQCMLKGPDSDIFFEIVDRHMHESLDMNAGLIGSVLVTIVYFTQLNARNLMVFCLFRQASWVVGPEQYMRLREDFIDTLNEGLPGVGCQSKRSPRVWVFSWCVAFA